MIDDTALLLRIDVADFAEEHDQLLEQLSATVITQISLEAKARAYQARIDRLLRRGAAQGLSVATLADAAGMGRDDVRRRLRGSDVAEKVAEVTQKLTGRERRRRR